MKLVIKNTTVEIKYRPLTWVEQTFNVENRVDSIIYGSTQTWVTGTGGYSYLVPCSSSMKKLKVIANSGKVSGIAFLTSNARVNGTTPDFCENTELNVVAKGTLEEFSIPNTCQYIYIMSGTSPADSNLPASVEIGES